MGAFTIVISSDLLSHPGAYVLLPILQIRKLRRPRAVFPMPYPKSKEIAGVQTPWLQAPGQASCHYRPLWVCALVHSLPLHSTHSFIHTPIFFS